MKRDQSNQWIQDVMPSEVVQLDAHATLSCLEERLGVEALLECLQPNHTTPNPHEENATGSWIKTSNMVGVNVRTIGSFWNVVKYALTLPPCQDSIHLLPIWEPGVVSSLYGMASWQINPEFFSEAWQRAVPGLDTVEKQLKACINILHAMGKTVGMDVIPHTDRYSEIVLANPSFFEWLRRRDMQIVDHRANLHEEVEKSLITWLGYEGSALKENIVFENFFQVYTEADRLKHLFGLPNDYEGRMKRRERIVDWLYYQGLEPIPATMAPPYRGIEVDPNPEAMTIDDARRVWRDYRITKPQKMSRVFGPLTRYKLYERLNDNQNWDIDFDRPRQDVWDYVCKKYSQVQQLYGFDFMRGDMSHVQMRQDGVPDVVDVWYDIHKAVKNHIQKRLPSFAYYAETFMAPPNEMAYGNEIDHLNKSEAEVTLGDLQSMVVGSSRFMEQWSWYIQVQQNGGVAPCFTILTADKDDPRFDLFYLQGSEARLFIALFLPDTPSYMALGYEQRDEHHTPAPNEYYTKLYVFQLYEGSKATKGPYQWGTNTTLWKRLQRIRQQATTLLLGEVVQPKVIWVIPPSVDTPVVYWRWENTPYSFVVNVKNIVVNIPDEVANGRCVFSTHTQEPHTGKKSLLSGEGCVFEGMK